MNEFGSQREASATGIVWLQHLKGVREELADLKAFEMHSPQYGWLHGSIAI
jgi:hypothetical protein